MFVILYSTFMLLSDLFTCAVNVTARVEKSRKDAIAGLVSKRSDSEADGKNRTHPLNED